MENKLLYKTSNVIKDIIEKIQASDSEAFARFSSEHAICFTEANGDWLFPALYDFYTEEVKNPHITKLLQELGMFFHHESMKEPYAEITSFDRSLCLDESNVFEYIVKQQNLASNDIKNVEMEGGVIVVATIKQGRNKPYLRRYSHCGPRDIYIQRRV